MLRSNEVAAPFASPFAFCPQRPSPSPVTSHLSDGLDKLRWTLEKPENHCDIFSSTEMRSSPPLSQSSPLHQGAPLPPWATPSVEIDEIQTLRCSTTATNDAPRYSEAILCAIEIVFLASFPILCHRPSLHVVDVTPGVKPPGSVKVSTPVALAPMLRKREG